MARPCPNIRPWARLPCGLRSCSRRRLRLKTAAATESEVMNRPRRIKIVLGTRGSDLALRQTGLVIDALQKRWADLKFEVKIISTRGDDEKTAITDIRAGRKGLFTGAI